MSMQATRKGAGCAPAAIMPLADGNVAMPHAAVRG